MKSSNTFLLKSTYLSFFVVLNLFCMQSHSGSIQSTILVDGRNGNIVYPKDNTSLTYAAGDSVTIKITYANLLYYNFYVVTGSTNIKRVYSAVGNNNYFVSDTNAVVEDWRGIRDGNILVNASKINGPNFDADLIKAEFADFISNLLAQVDTLKQIANPTIYEVKNSNSYIYHFFKDDSTWSNAITTKSSPRWLDRPLQKLLILLADIAYFKETINKLNAIDSERIPLNLFKRNIDTLTGDLIALRNDIEGARSELLRRNNIIYNNPNPCMKLNLKIDQESQRYFFRIYRKRIGEEDSKSKDTSAIAVIVLEGHSRNWINYSMGLASVFQDYSRSYLFINRSDNDTMFSIQEDKSESRKTIPYLAIGFYLFKPVDEFNDYWLNGFMVFIGTEISTTPRYFLFGIDADFSIGLSIGGGITPYKKTTLSDGWSIDSQVSKTTKSNLSGNVPVKNEFGVGWFINLGLRPEIFKFFKKLVS